MSVSTVTPTTTDSWYDGKRLHVVGTLAVGASPLTYATGGIALSFAGVQGVLSSQPPVWVKINGISGFGYQFVTGTTIANGLMKIFVEATVATNTPLAEHTAVAVVSGVSSDTIYFEAIFKLR